MAIPSCERLDGAVTIEIPGDRRTVEALVLEVRRLAAAYGIELRTFRMHPSKSEEPAHEPSPEGENGGR